MRGNGVEYKLANRLKYLGLLSSFFFQGEDLLFQIFTSNILQRKCGEEAPFLEFIQRVCSECVGPDGCPRKLKPGCGGFGIRNFLTLFLSIEITKAMTEAASAKELGDQVRHEFFQNQVNIFTNQLNESNPILNDISDAMTREGIAREKIDLFMETWAHSFRKPALNTYIRLPR